MLTRVLNGAKQAKNGLCHLPWTMYQVGLDWTISKLLETGLTRLAPVMDPEAPECYICKEMDPFLASCVQVMLGYNVF